MLKRSVTLVTCALLAGCGGGGGLTPAPTPSPTPAIVLCALINPPTLALVSPVPGSTNVPDNTNALFFSGIADGPGGSSAIKMTWPSGGFFQTSVLTPTNNGYSVALPQLLPATTYTVYNVISTGQSAPCNTINVNLGSFTTQ